MSKWNRSGGVQAWVLRLSFVLAAAQPGWSQSVWVTTLHTFGAVPDGAQSLAGLVPGANNAFYGTTYLGGVSNVGAVFMINQDGTGYQVMHSFTNLYAAEGVAPAAGLLLATNGFFYGTTSGNNGAVFRLSPDGITFQSVHSFTLAGGSRPRAKLVQGVDGLLYGTTSFLNANIFKMDLDGNNYSVLHTFTNSPDGSAPYAGVIQGKDGALYGTTKYGGANGSGTVYKIYPTGSGYQVLHSFTGTNDGQSPVGALYQANDGLLYGTTSAGGTNGLGTLYLIDTNGLVFQVVHTFQGGNDGSSPQGSLIQAPDNALYGTTQAGGSSNNGTLFRFEPGGEGYQVPYSFTGGTDGQAPDAELAPGPSSGNNGVLYGTTHGSGSAGNNGTVFAAIVNPPLSITPQTYQPGTNPPLVFWPAWAINYQLQTTTNLTSPDWVNVSNGIPVVGFQLTNTSPAAYFRLSLPR